MHARILIAALIASATSLPAVALESAKFVVHGQPQYPREALTDHVQGCVTLSFSVGPDGLADNFQVLRSVPARVFDEAALGAIYKSRFEASDGKQRYQTTLTFYPREHTPRETRCDSAQDSPTPVGRK